MYLSYFTTTVCVFRRCFVSDVGYLSSIFRFFYTHHPSAPKLPSLCAYWRLSFLCISRIVVVPCCGSRVSLNIKLHYSYRFYKICSVILVLTVLYYCTVVLTFSVFCISTRRASHLSVATTTVVVRVHKTPSRRKILCNVRVFLVVCYPPYCTPPLPPPPPHSSHAKPPFLVLRAFDLLLFYVPLLRSH